MKITSTQGAIMRLIGYNKYKRRPHWRVEYTVGKEPVGVLVRATMTKEKARQRADCYIYAHHSTWPLRTITFQRMELRTGRKRRQR